MPPRKKKEEKNEEEHKGPLTFEELMADVASNGGFAQTNYLPVERIDTGSISLNQALGQNGIPLGLTTHLAGPTGSGKTTLAVQIGVAAVKAGMSVAVINQEYRWNPSLAYRSGMGVPGKDYLLFSFPSGEDALNTVVKLMRNGVRLVIFDSVAAGASKMEADTEKLGEGGAYGAMAKMWSEFFRVHSSTIHNNHAALLLLNQFRSSMGGLYDPKFIRPGGKALEYYPAIAADMRSIARDDRIYTPGDNQAYAKLVSDEKTKAGGALMPIGVTIEGKTWKNTTAANFRTFSLEVLFQNGGAFLNWPRELAEWGKALGVFRNKDGEYLGANGHWYLDGEKVGESTEKTIAYLEDPVNIERVQKVRKMISEALLDYE